MDLLSEKRIQWPSGKVTRLAPEFAAAIDVDIWNRKSVVDMPALTGATTLNLIPDAEIEDGAEVTVNVDQGAAGYDVAFGSNIVGDALTGAPNDKDTLVFQYSKSAGKFRLVSKFKTVDVV
jgi:hypothetical protein